MKLVVIILSLLLIPNLLAMRPPPNGPGCPRCKKVEGKGDLAGTYYFHRENYECENGCSYERDDGECCFCFAPGEYSVTKCDHDTGDMTSISTPGPETCNKEWLEKYRGLRPTPSNQNNRIIGGTQVPPAKWTDWPWTASLRTEKSDGKFYKCGGALISCNCIVTAKHCLQDKNTTALVSPLKVKISLGKGGTTYMQGASQFTGHAIYYINTGNINGNPEDDIAVIEMNHKINTATNIRPILLSDDFPPTKNEHEGRSEEFYVTGWGLTPAPTDFLHETNQLKLRPGGICKALDPSFNVTKEICPERFVGDALCPGDSGSPGMIEDTTNEKWSIYAVASYNNGNCTDAGFGGMVAVAYYADKLDLITQGIIPPLWSRKV